MTHGLPGHADARAAALVAERLELNWRLENRAEVSVRGKRVRCSADELAGVAGGASGGKEARAARREAVPPAPGRPGTGDLDESKEVAPELNLIGMRVEPALEELETYIDRAILAARKSVRVVHGHGSGRLRQAVRQRLRAHRGVGEIRAGAPNEGGDGATVVTLRGA